MPCLAPPHGSWSVKKEEEEPGQDEAKGNKGGYQTLDRRRAKGGFTTDWGPRGFQKANHPLSIMVREGVGPNATEKLVTNYHMMCRWRVRGQSY